MKKYFLLVAIALFVTACNNERKLLLPQAEISVLTTVENHSPVYLFFNEQSKDSLPEVNRKNTISSTSWIFNVDKRLSLQKAIPEIIKLQAKKESSLHKDATSQNYYSYSNSQKKELAFLPFTNSTYQMSAPKKGMTLYFTKNNKVTIVHQQDTIAQNIEFSNIQNTIHQNLDDVTPELSFCFDKNLSFNQYIQYKVWLYLNMQKWFVGPNKTVVEYIY